MTMRSKQTLPRIPFWLGTSLFLATAAFYLWTEHRAHALGALPYLIMPTTILLHLLMHRGHGQGEDRGHSHGVPGGRDSDERGGER